MEPKIRFKGFEGEWIETSLSNLSSNFKYGINAAAVSFDGENKYLRITDIDDTMHSFLQNDVTSPGTDLSCCDEYLMQDGDIVIARTGASVGKSYIYHPFDGKVYFAGFLIRMRLNENTNRDFVFQNTLTNAYAKHVQFVSQRSGQPGINVNELQAYKLRIPSLSEQQFIATYFRTLDNKIQSTSKKLASLKKLKSASLVAMFPQNGESTPKVRFKGFEGEWKKVKLGNVCSVNRGTRITKKELNTNQSYPVYQNTNYPLGYYKNYNVEANNPYVIIGGSAGLIGFSNVPFWAADDCAYFGDNDSLDKAFLYSTLLSHIAEIKKNVRGSSVPRLDRSTLIDLEINLPSFSEQQAIASFFRSLDRKIALETARLEKLKQIKRACLDKMFV